MVVKQTNCNTIWLLFAYPTYIHPINSNNMLNIRFTREVVIEGNTKKSEPIKSDLDVISHMNKVALLSFSSPLNGKYCFIYCCDC